MNLYFVHMYEGVEPVLHGPFDTEENLLRAATKINDNNPDDTLFKIGSFGNIKVSPITDDNLDHYRMVDTDNVKVGKQTKWNSMEKLDRAIYLKGIGVDSDTAFDMASKNGEEIPWEWLNDIE